MICATHEGDTTDYTYDTSGAVTNTKGDKNITYTYDAKGRLIKYVTRENGTPVITEYTYDYQGTRTSKTVDGKETQYITYSMNGLSYVLYEADASGNIEAEYVRGCQLHTMTKDSETYVYLSDAHMDVRALADSEGNLVNHYRYDAWGNTLYVKEEVENSYRYCQEEYDAESGNTYLRARYYNAGNANFLSADEYAGSIDNPMTLNKYAYAGANPVMYADPSVYAFTLAECLTTTHMQNILRTAKTISLNGLIGGLISALDAMSAGGSKEEVLAAFCIGVPVGIAGGAIFRGVGGVLTKFMGAKLANATIALTGFGFGMYGAGRSISEGEYWQALYRAGVSTLGISLWYRQFGAETNKLLQEALQRLKGGSNGQSAATGSSSSNKIFSTGKEGEQEIANMFGGNSQKYFKTTYGGRYVDQYADGIAHESKVGYTTLNNRIRLQIYKDYELIKTGQIDGAHWHFFTSGITGKGGASQPLMNALAECGIKYTIY